MAESILDLTGTDCREQFLQLEGPCPPARYSSATTELATAASVLGTQAWDVVRMGDMVSAVWLEIPHEGSVDPLSLIDSVALLLGPQTLDELDSPWLRVRASYDRTARPVQLRSRTLWPIKFGVFGPRGLFPLVSLSREAPVRIVCRIKTEVELKAFATYHVFDKEARRAFPKQHALPSWHHRCMQFDVESIGDCQQLRLHNFDGPVRELIVLVQPEARAEACAEPVVDLRLYLDGCRRTDSSPSWHRHVDARKYGVDDNQSLVYYMPFDDAPLESRPACTLNLSRFLDRTLKLRLAPGKFKVAVCARVFNIMCVTEELSGLKWRNRGRDDGYPGLPAVK